MRPLLQLELNEINFESLERYAESGELPAFKSFFEQHGYTQTSSEDDYAYLEPWIQWVTAHTGKSFAEHGVFRLGDIVGTTIPQIWEQLEAEGYKVGAISPMNAECRLKDPAFFVPDPWTPTEVKASPSIKRLHAAISQAVNDNANSRITPRSLIEIGISSLKAIRPSTVGRYGALVANAVRKPWSRAMYLDLLLADLFSNSVAQSSPDFASLFLNAGAHIQHHYMFSSALYEGPFRNPSWYVDPTEDPVLDVYRLYDGILGRLHSRFPKARILLVTALHQDPYPELQFYWRLRNHADFLAKIDVPFKSVEPRMSRDFVIRCASVEEARAAEFRLSQVASSDGVSLFTIDNRGTDLFVELTYPNDIPAEAEFCVGNVHHAGLRDIVAFVAIKNGCHNGIGYFADSGERLGKVDGFPLTGLPTRIRRILNQAGPQIRAG
jgi:hypothetical protein